MTHYSAHATGKPSRPANLSTPLLALLREHTDQPWEVDPDDPTMAILRVPILDLVREHLSESEPVKPAQPVKPVQKAPAKAPSKPQDKPVWPVKSEAQVRREIKLRARRADGIASHEVADLVPGSSEVRTAFLNGMIDDNLLEKRGHSKATRYFVVGAKVKPATKPVTKPPPKPATKAVKKPPLKVTAPPRKLLDLHEIIKGILEILADGKQHKSSEFYRLWETDEEAKREFSGAMKLAGRDGDLIEQTGHGPGTRYTLVEQEEVEAPAEAEPDPDLFDFKPPLDEDEGASE